MNYAWTVINQDKNTIQFCVTQSGGYANCASIPGNSTQTFTIPNTDVQIYGTPRGYYVYYTSVQVRTGTKSLPPSGSTITVPPFQGCNPLLTRGQGYPAIVPCKYPGILFLKSESTPGVFIENWGAEPAGFAYGYGIAGSQLGIAVGPGWAYHRQYPKAQVYLIGNWAIDSSGNYVDQDSGRKYCGCPGKSVYIIPTSALPGPSSTTTSSGTGTTTSTGTTTGQQTTGTTTGQQTTGTTQTTGILNVANQCSSGVVVNAGGKSAYVPPYHAISLEVPIPTSYTLISQGQLIGKGTVYKSGEYVSPQTCPSSPSPTPTPSPSPSGGTSTSTTTTTTTTTPTTHSQQMPWEVLLILVILGTLALSS